MNQRRMLSSDNGPIFISEKSLRALLAIRRERLVEQVYGSVLMARSNWQAMADVLTEVPSWMTIVDDAPDQSLPLRVSIGIKPTHAATIRAALANDASLILIEGPIKEKVKLSYIKAEGVVSLLVAAYRQGLISAVRPMVKALVALGHEDVLPPPEALDALWVALDQLSDG
jgi:predicted nucleic acid-binding protein